MTGYPTPAPAVKTARTILANAIPDTTVVTKLPFPDYPAKMIRVSRAGGHRPNIVTDAPRLLIECWTKTVEDAETLANTAIAALQNSQGTTTDGVFSRGFENIEGPVDFPDPQISDHERWQFLGDLLLSTS